MDIKTLSNFIEMCFKLGITSEDCSDLLDIIEPDNMKQIRALMMWMERVDDAI